MRLRRQPPESDIQTCHARHVEGHRILGYATPNQPLRQVSITGSSGPKSA